MAQEAQMTGDVSLVGDLASWPLTEILLWLCHTERTAMMRVGDGLQAGVLFVERGQVFRCEWGEHAGEAALFGLLAQNSGAFQLIQREPPLALANVHRHTRELLHIFALDSDDNTNRRVA